MPEPTMLASSGVDHEADHKETMTDSTRLVSMNLSGRFKGREIKRFGQDVIKHILKANDVGIFFGQQMNFQPSLPDNYVFEGGSRAFVYYDKNLYRGCDEKQYRHYLKDMENKGRLRRYYLPDANFVAIKMRTRAPARSKFLAISWMTDECQGKLKSISLLRKLLSFAADLCAIEEMPVIMSGTFRVTLEEVKSVVYTEFEGFRVYGYAATRPKRMMRLSNVFITAKPVKMDAVQPLLCDKIVVRSDMTERWFNPEDAFYWDPVICSMRMRRSRHTSSRHTHDTSHDDLRELAPHPNISDATQQGGSSHVQTTYIPRRNSVHSDNFSDFTEMERMLKHEEDNEDEDRPHIQLERADIKAAVSAPSLSKQPDDAVDLADTHRRAKTPIEPPEKHDRVMQPIPDVDDPAVFARLEETMRRIQDKNAKKTGGVAMAATSAEIQETLLKLSTEDSEVNEFISRTNVPYSSRLGVSPVDSTDHGSRSKTPRGFINPDEYEFEVHVDRKEEKIAGFDTFGLTMTLNRQDELDIQLADTNQLLTSLCREPNDMRFVEGSSQLNLSENSETTSHDWGYSGQSEEEDGGDGMMSKVPSYMELYDEELLENNTLCYMQ